MLEKSEVLGEKLKDAKLKGMVNELLDACVKITEAGLSGSSGWLVNAPYLSCVDLY